MGRAAAGSARPGARSWRRPPRGAGCRPGPVTAPARPIGEVPIEDSLSRTSGVPELDRVLGGGLVPGRRDPAGRRARGRQVHAAARGGRADRAASGTASSTSPVRSRPRRCGCAADRTGAIQDELYLAAETDLGAVLGHVEAVKPTLLVVDSVQTISAGDVDGVPGGRHPGQGGLGRPDPDGQAAQHHPGDHRPRHQGRHHRRTARARAPRRRRAALRGRAHLAAADGARGEEPLRTRSTRSAASTSSAEGIVAITDPTGLFLDTRHGPVPGTCVAVALEGRRPLLSEVQALVTHSAGERPRRTTSGVDSARVAMILAVLQQHAGIRLHNHDVFVSSVGGARLTEPSNDLAIALAIASAWLRPAAGPQRRGHRRARALRRAAPGPRRRACGWPRPGGWGSAPRWSRPRPRRARGTSRVLDGMRVVDVDNIARALSLLGAGKGVDGAAERLTPLGLLRVASPSDPTTRPACAATWPASPPAPRCVTVSSASCAAAPAP